MACNACSTCCRLIVFEVKDFTCEMKEVMRLKRNFIKFINYKGKQYCVMESTCKYLDEELNLCKHYNNRPIACEKYPDGIDKNFLRLITPECGYNKK